MSRLNPISRAILRAIVILLFSVYYSYDFAQASVQSSDISAEEAQPPDSASELASVGAESGVRLWRGLEHLIGHQPAGSHQYAQLELGAPIESKPRSSHTPKYVIPILLTQATASSSVQPVAAPLASEVSSQSIDEEAADFAQSEELARQESMGAHQPGAFVSLTRPEPLAAAESNDFSAESVSGAMSMTPGVADKARAEAAVVAAAPSAEPFVVQDDTTRAELQEPIHGAMIEEEGRGNAVEPSRVEGPLSVADALASAAFLQPAPSAAELVVDAALLAPFNGVEALSSVKPGLSPEPEVVPGAEVPAVVFSTDVDRVAKSGVQTVVESPSAARGDALTVEETSLNASAHEVRTVAAIASAVAAKPTAARMPTTHSGPTTNFGPNVRQASTAEEEIEGATVADPMLPVVSTSADPMPALQVASAPAPVADVQEAVVLTPAVSIESAEPVVQAALIEPVASVEPVSPVASSGKALEKLEPSPAPAAVVTVEPIAEAPHATLADAASAVETADVDAADPVSLHAAASSVEAIGAADAADTHVVIPAPDFAGSTDVTDVTIDSVDVAGVVPAESVVVDPMIKADDTEKEEQTTHLSITAKDVPAMFQLPPPLALPNEPVDVADTAAVGDASTGASVTDTVSMDGPPIFDVAEPSSREAGDVYLLGAGDVLKVTVWGYPELSETVVVLPNGTVTYPMIGTIPAANLSAQQLADDIRVAFEPYIESPNVSVTVTEMRSRRVSVLGRVKQPGVYSLWSEQTSVLEVIAQAGGLEPDAFAQDLRLFRYDADGVKHTLRVNLEEVLKGTSSARSVTIRSGDVVFVPGQETHQKICILGQVNGPGLYTLRENMTLIQALSAAGWVKSSAILRSVLVARKGPNGEKEYHKINVDEIIQKQDWSQDMRLAAGDVVYVPEKFFSKLSTFVGYFTGSVEPAANSYLGVYDASRPMERP